MGLWNNEVDVHGGVAASSHDRLRLILWTIDDYNFEEFNVI